MSTNDERVAMILKSEREFAEDLAQRVIEKPAVSVWMILIPILIVYHMYRHTRYAEGRKQFVEHFMPLLKADGGDRDSLIRSSYGSGTAYLLAMNRLNAAERKLYNALSIRLREQQDDVNSMVASIEAESERLRREEAHRIFG